MGGIKNGKKERKIKPRVAPVSTIAQNVDDSMWVLFLCSGVGYV